MLESQKMVIHEQNSASLYFIATHRGGNVPLRDIELYIIEYFSMGIIC